MAQVSEARVAILLEALGIDKESFSEVVEWVLVERLVEELASMSGIDHVMGRPNELKLFRDLLGRRTNRAWKLEDVRKLLSRVRVILTPTARRPTSPEEVLLLKLRDPLKCKMCGASPPDVVLHIDHVVPASRGGSSKLENLQFLCQQDNLHKSNKRQLEEPWLDLA